MCYYSMNHSNAVCQRNLRSNRFLFKGKISSQVAETLYSVNATLALKYRIQGEGGKHKIG